MNTYTVTLKGPAPWGFRLQGGKDFSMPLTVSRLTPGGKAAQAGVGPGDWVVSIDHANAEEMTHVEAQNKIRAAGDTLTLSLSSRQAPEPKYSFAPSMSLNKMPRPFISGSDDTNLGPVTKPVTYVPTAPKFNAPANVLQQHNGRFLILARRVLCKILNPENENGNTRNLDLTSRKATLMTSVKKNIKICCAIADQLRLHFWDFCGFVVEKRVPCCQSRTGSYFFLNFKNHVDIKRNIYGIWCSRHSLRVESVPCYLANDASKKRLIEDTQDWQPRTGTTQSRSFRILAQLTGTDFMQDPDDENLKKSRNEIYRNMPRCSVTGIMSGLPVPSISSPERPQTEQIKQSHISKYNRLTLFILSIFSDPDKKKKKKSVFTVYLAKTKLQAPKCHIAVTNKLLMLKELKNVEKMLCSGVSLSDSYVKIVKLQRTLICTVTSPLLGLNAEMPECLLSFPILNCRLKRMAISPPPPLFLAKMTPRPAAGPSCRPPWVTDPNFADRYHPDKTSTVLTRHSQPAQPTPMQNRSSIVQAAQQAPEDSSRTPVCAACSKIIRGRYLVALGRSWHPEEFTCSQCKVVLEEGGFFEERGSILCTKCYDSRYAPNCAKCKKIITGEIMHALKMTWHVHCFICAACKIPIRNKAFYMEEGEPYCEKDYEKMFGTKCHGCDFKIDAGDRFLEALGYSWHDTCFVCAICQINLEGKTFYSKKDKPLCKTHAFSHV
uniref:PDZ and LIM domain protein 7 n=1 Tax=Lepisosteus oculatus TaxID=7918 RepID=W5N202_LEPOC